MKVSSKLMCLMAVLLVGCSNNIPVGVPDSEIETVVESVCEQNDVFFDSDEKNSGDEQYPILDHKEDVGGYYTDIIKEELLSSNLIDDNEVYYATSSYRLGNLEWVIYSYYLVADFNSKPQIYIKKINGRYENDKKFHIISEDDIKLFEVKDYLNEEQNDFDDKTMTEIMSARDADEKMLIELYNSLEYAYHQNLSEPVAALELLMNVQGGDATLINEYENIEVYLTDYEYKYDVRSARYACTIKYNLEDGTDFVAIMAQYDSIYFPYIIFSNYKVGEDYFNKKKGIQDLIDSINYPEDIINVKSVDSGVEYIYANPGEICKLASDKEVTLYGIAPLNYVIVVANDEMLKTPLIFNDILPRVYSGDFDGDSETEYVIITLVDRGSGFSNEDIYLIKKIDDQFTLFECPRETVVPNYEDKLAIDSDDYLLVNQVLSFEIQGDTIYACVSDIYKSKTSEEVIKKEYKEIVLLSIILQ